MLLQSICCILGQTNQKQYVLSEERVGSTESWTFSRQSFQRIIFQFWQNSRLPRAWYLFLFCLNFCPPKKKSVQFSKADYFQKKVELSVFLGVGVNFDGSLCFRRRTLPRASNSYFYYILRTIRKILSLNLFWPNLYKQHGISLH